MINYLKTIFVLMLSLIMSMPVYGMAPAGRPGAIPQDIEKQNLVARVMARVHQKHSMPDLDQKDAARRASTPSGPHIEPRPFHEEHSGPRSIMNTAHVRQQVETAMKETHRPQERSGPPAADTILRAAPNMEAAIERAMRDQAIRQSHHQPTAAPTPSHAEAMHVSSSGEATPFVEAEQGNPNFGTVEVRSPESPDDGHLEKADEIFWVAGGVAGAAVGAVAEGAGLAAGAARAANAAGEKAVETLAARIARDKLESALKPEEGTNANAGERLASGEHSIPQHWATSPSKKGDGIKYQNPNNPNHDYVRVMPGNKESPWPMQQNPYAVRMKDGKALDKNGNPIKPSAEEAHIPLSEFKFFD